MTICIKYDNIPINAILLQQSSASLMINGIVNTHKTVLHGKYL